MKNTECIGELWLKILIYTQSESLKEQRNNGPTAILQRFSTRLFKCWGGGGGNYKDKSRMSYVPKEDKDKQPKRLHKANHTEFLKHKANKKP